jgi:uncharacterized membrane protein YsdA (DUF1294 family)
VVIADFTANAFLYYLLVINILTFFVYGIDKWRSTYGRLLPTGRKKAKQGSRRISEATLLMLAVIGGTIGALLGMQVWRHKTKHKKFKYGLPLILLAQIALIYLISNN